MLRKNLVIATLLALLPLVLTGCFRVGADARALRDSLMKSGKGEWDEQIEIGVGAITLGLAKVTAHFADPHLNIPPEARTILSSVHGAEVGVYKLQSSPKDLNRAAMLAAADRVMAKRDWDRLVTVLDRGQLVIVYVPENTKSKRNIKVCVVVVDAHQMVIASARSDVEPLFQMAMTHVNRHERRQELTGL